MDVPRKTVEKELFLMNQTPQVYYATGNEELFVLIHGQQSSKREWFDITGYTKGGSSRRALWTMGSPRERLRSTGNLPVYYTVLIIGFNKKTPSP
jgi:hypothetical protein